jgi:hypothetical protein
MEALDIADARSDTYLQTPKKPVISAWAFLDLCQIAESLTEADYSREVGMATGISRPLVG